MLVCVFSTAQVYVLKRPYVDEFLQKMGELFECVLFTASLAKVGDICICQHQAITVFCLYQGAKSTIAKMTGKSDVLFYEI